MTALLRLVLTCVIVYGVLSAFTWAWDMEQRFQDIAQAARIAGR